MILLQRSECVVCALSKRLIMQFKTLLKGREILERGEKNERKAKTLR